MDTLKKRIRFLRLGLTRQKNQLEPILKQKTIDIERLSKLEAQLSMDILPLKEQFDTTLLTLVEGLDDSKDDDKKLMEQWFKEQDEVREFANAVSGKIKFFNKSLKAEETRQSLVPSRNSEQFNQSFSSSSSSQPKLEKIPIPKFDGDILKFNNFRGLFENLVHNNGELLNVQKLHYLKEAFVGEAEEAIRYFELNNQSYSEAWAYVLNRYDNPRAVVRALFRKLQYLEPIKNERGIRSLLDQVNIVIRGLKSTGETISDTFSRYITYHVGLRLDATTARDWENSLKGTSKYPKFDELEKFLQNRTFSVEDRTTEFNQSKLSSEKINQPRIGKKSFVTTKLSCVVCSQPHFLNQCKEFLAKPVIDRFNIVKKHRLCIKCFNNKHNLSDCTRPNCGTCKGNHHQLLHRETTAVGVIRDPTKEHASTAETTVSSAVPKTTLSMTANNKRVVLPTAVVKIKIGSKFVFARLLLDICSEATLVTKSFVETHSIRTYKAKQPTALGCIVDGVNILDSVADIILQSRYSNFQLPISAEVVNKIPYDVDGAAVLSVKQEFSHLQFAECTTSSTHVDILLGAEFYEYVIEDTRYFVEKLTFRDTKFGFVISGRRNSSLSSSTTYCGLTKLDIDTQLKKFWELEEPVDSRKSTNQDVVVEYQIIEEHFEKTFARDESGRFILRLPTKNSVSCLNGSFSKAFGMLKKSERFLSSEVRQEYLKFMEEYEQLGHMRKLTASESQNAQYYIPHQIVRKLSSTTTKYRVVFNASASDLSGTSLNEHLMVGPTLQPELFDTVVKFRHFQTAFCADIEKMYRQILVHPDDRKFQCILWRQNSGVPVSHFELATITYGTGCASYLATKCLEVVANNLLSTNPAAAHSIKNNFYMDDLITGADSVIDAVQLQQSIHSSLLQYGFPLRKYQSNSDEFLRNLDSSLVENMASRSLGDESSINLLGLIWCPKIDMLRVVLNINPLPKIITKRILLSDVARIFDILGVLAPVTVRAKIILQDLWRESLKWDDPISANLQSKFLNYRNELSFLKNYSIPRRYSGLTNLKGCQLIGFCDASPKAYCATIFLRCVDDQLNVSVNFVCAKTKIAPLKALTIPRLELQSAVLLSQLINRIANNLNVNVNNIFAFSDSTIVLSWLNHPINLLKTYVANRVDKILKIIPYSNWHYVQTTSNPADLATRGLDVQKFISNSLWLNGPDWLKANFEKFINVKLENNVNLPEIRTLKTCALNAKIDISILTRFSSYSKLINVIAYVNRFLNNFLKLSTHYDSLLLSVNEREISLNCIIRLSQQSWFAKEIECLLNKIEVKKNSRLRSLDPFLDENNIVRVGGRLKNSQFSYDKKHPIILFSKCNFVTLLIRYLHEKYFHCSRAIIFSFIENRYWIVGGANNTIKKLIRECTLCTRLRAHTSSQLMGQLPSSRVNPCRPFLHVGIDFCGPFTIRCLGHRSLKYNKSYAAFFVCFSTRAVHIEIVSDLSSGKFLESLRRFVARRGLPSHVYSDNGKNFVGASNQLFRERSKILEFATGEGIHWHFITPRAPHQGGLWEAAIKSGKSLLVKATRNSVLSYEELHTIFCQVESILNSRPLCYRHESDESFGVLTPGHFLIGTHLLASPIDRAVTDADPATRFTQSQSIIRSFWQEWRKTYINNLQSRNKWYSRQPNLVVNDIVVIKEDNVPVLCWPLGKIIAVYPDPEGLVRNVTVQTSTGTYNRSITRIVRLVAAEGADPFSRGE